MTLKWLNMNYQILRILQFFSVQFCSFYHKIIYCFQISDSFLFDLILSDLTYVLLYNKLPQTSCLWTIYYFSWLCLLTAHLDGSTVVSCLSSCTEAGKFRWLHILPGDLVAGTLHVYLIIWYFSLDFCTWQRECSKRER